MRHQLPDGRVLWVLEGPVDEVGSLNRLLEAAGLSISKALRAQLDYVVSEAGTTVRTSRMMAVAAYLPADSLDALAGKLTQKE